MILAALMMLQAAAAPAPVAPPDAGPHIWGIDGKADARWMEREGASSLQAMNDCYRVTALRLGVGNTEPADTVIKAARSLCDAQIQRYRASWPVIYMGQGRVDALVERDQVKAEDAAIAALLAARHP